MEKNVIVDLKAKLEAVRDIVAATGETDFEELGRKNKVKILNLFGDDGDTDGDSDGVFMTFKFGDDFKVVFESKCEDTSDFAEYIHGLWFEYNGDQYDATTDTIQSVLDYIGSLVPATIGLLNTSTLTAPGDYSLKAISLNDAKNIATNYTLDSAIGHASTAQIMTTLLGVDVPVNRQMFAQDVVQQCLVFKLRGRPEEGKILTAEEINKIGYDWQLLVRNS